MNNNEQQYISILKKLVYDKISVDINEQTIEDVVKNDLYKSHIDDKKSANFQDFYFKTLNNEELYLIETKFFQQFKQQYSLQGIDNKFLNKLELQKKEILKLIRDNNLTELYFGTFKKAEIKHGDGVKEKDLGSFFAKLVHTFRPKECCALDNPIKRYFGLTKESFFIAFFIISVEYLHWATDNKELLEVIREKFKLLDKEQVIKHDHITDLKLLDLIFWSKANRTN